MTARVQLGGLSVAEPLHRFVMEEALPGSGVEPVTFWSGADAIIHDLAPRNRQLLSKREELQAKRRRVPPSGPRDAGRPRGL